MQMNLLSWFYLVKNEWIKFDKDSLLTDNTLKFIHTGIIKLKMPEDISLGNTILNPSYYWIKACCKTFISTKVKAVFTQVIQANKNN